jgi:ribosomal protein S18 acetylase RimI-like enzyme
VGSVEMGRAMEAKVREARAGDAGVLYELACELARTVGDVEPAQGAVRARLIELLEEPGARVLVAEGPDGVVGAASAWIKPDLAHGDRVVEVPMLVVSREHRRRGLGRMLLEAVRELATRSGASLIELVATRDNESARNFYRSFGFVETEHVALEYVGDLRGEPLGGDGS